MLRIGEPVFFLNAKGLISGRGRDSELAERICGRLNAAAEIVLVPGLSMLGDAGEAVRTDSGEVEYSGGGL